MEHLLGALVFVWRGARSREPKPIPWTLSPPLPLLEKGTLLEDRVFLTLTVVLSMHCPVAGT